MRSMKLKYLICNHKNKLTYDEVKQYINELKKIDTSKVNFVICPSTIYLPLFSDYTLGSQDVSAYSDCVTGEITAEQLKSLGVSYVLIGHAERRGYLKEDKKVLKAKIEQANLNHLKVVYCISEEEKNFNDAKRKIKKELLWMKKYLTEDTLIAYEPKWAIGKDIELDIDYISKILSFIKSLMNQDVLYGGSVNEKTIDSILMVKNLSGFLLSNSALNLNVLQNVMNKIS